MLYKEKILSSMKPDQAQEVPIREKLLCFHVLLPILPHTAVVSWSVKTHLLECQTYQNHADIGIAKVHLS